MAKELTKVVETTEEIIVTTLDKKLVNKFDKAYESAGKSMRDMCILAYQICGEDKDARALFQKHIVDDLGMSKSTASQLVSTGGIYTNYPDTQIMSHTKCAELLPVRNDVTAFLDSVEMDVVELNTLTQAKIRDKVKSYLNPQDDTQDTQDAPQDAQDAPQDAQDIQDTQDAQDAPQDAQDARVKELESKVKYLQACVRLSYDVLKSLNDTYEFDEDDTKNVKSILKDLTKAVK